MTSMIIVELNSYEYTMSIIHSQKSRAIQLRKAQGL